MVPVLKLSPSFTVRLDPSLLRAKSLGVSLRGLVMPEFTPPPLPADIVGASMIVDRRLVVEERVRASEKQLDSEAEELAEDEGFRSPCEKARDVARQIATNVVLGLMAADGAHAFTPRFGIAGDGGVALHWRTPRVELLMTVSAAGDGARYYGESSAGENIKGAFHGSEPGDFLARWLAQHELPRRGDP